MVKIFFGRFFSIGKKKCHPPRKIHFAAGTSWFVFHPICPKPTMIFGDGGFFIFSFEQSYFFLFFFLFFLQRASSRSLKDVCIHAVVERAKACIVRVDGIVYVNRSHGGYVAV